MSKNVKLEELNSQLIGAAGSLSIELAQTAISQGADNLSAALAYCMFLNDGYSTILRENYREFAEFLISQGADVNGEHGSGELMKVAAYVGSVEAIRFLAEHGADVNIKDEHGHTPLYFGISADNNLEVVKALIECGADIDSIDTDGRRIMDRLNVVSHFQEIKEYVEQKRLEAFKEEMGTIFTEKELKNILYALHKDGEAISPEVIQEIKENAIKKGFKSELGDMFNEKHLSTILFDLYNDGQDIDPEIKKAAYVRQFEAKKASQAAHPISEHLPSSESYREVRHDKANKTISITGMGAYVEKAGKQFAAALADRVEGTTQGRSISSAMLDEAQKVAQEARAEVRSDGDSVTQTATLTPVSHGRGSTNSSQSRN